MKKKLPLSSQRALRKVGQDIEAARKRRRIPLELMAERVGVSRNTYSKIEEGDPSVAWGTVVNALMVLQMTDRLTSLADASQDEVGLFAETEKLPKRIRVPRNQ